MIGSTKVAAAVVAIFLVATCNREYPAPHSTACREPLHGGVSCSSPLRHVCYLTIATIATTTEYYTSSSSSSMCVLLPSGAPHVRFANKGPASMNGSTSAATHTALPAAHDEKRKPRKQLMFSFATCIIRDVMNSMQLNYILYLTCLIYLLPE